MPIMKAVIIGGGIAGLAVAIALKKANKEVVVREMHSMKTRQGLAFMVNSNTMEVIQSIVDIDFDLTSHEINNFFLLDCDGNKKKNIELTGWYAVKRGKLLSLLLSHLSENEYYENSAFSYFKYDGNKAVAAVFEDGSIEYGDLFIGADGINSKVRESVCEADFYPNEVNEIVCITKNTSQQSNDHIFRKYESLKKGMAFGFIPISKDEHVYFLQFDSNLYADLGCRSREGLKKLSSDFVPDFPNAVKEIIGKSDLSQAHLWINKELKLLSNYYKGNICLIGDAAHGSISLTSSGVHSGILSAIKLAEVLSENQSLEVALEEFDKDRKEANTKTIEFAQILKDQFSGRNCNMKKYNLPLYK